MVCIVLQFRLNNLYTISLQALKEIHLENKSGESMFEVTPETV